MNYCKQLRLCVGMNEMWVEHEQKTQIDVYPVHSYKEAEETIERLWSGVEVWLNSEPKSVKKKRIVHESNPFFY